MKTLKIEDLSQNDAMDPTALAHVSGGRLPQVMVDLIQAVHDGTHPSGEQNPVASQFQQLLQSNGQG